MSFTTHQNDSFLGGGPKENVGLKKWGQHGTTICPTNSWLWFQAMFIVNAIRNGLIDIFKWIGTYWNERASHSPFTTIHMMEDTISLTLISIDWIPFNRDHGTFAFQGKARGRGWEKSNTKP